MQDSRFGGLDLLRVVMVFCVIVFHASMTYMAYVPPWWYVIDARNSLFFSVFVVILDTFPIPTLFFLSGYFSPPSLTRSGRRKFIADKLKHVGIPWIFGVLFVAPFFAAATMKAFLPLPSAAVFMRTQFFGPFYQQGPYWFLGILLLFQLGYAFAARADRCRTEPGTPPSTLLIAVPAVSAAFFFISARWLMPPEGWLNAGYILHFQPARIVCYALIFFLGVYGRSRHWFARDGWRPSLGLWGLFAVLSLCVILWWKLAVAPSPDLAPIASAAGNAIFSSLAAFAIPLFLVSLFLRARGSLLHIARRFGPTSYGTYWLHLIVLMPLLHAMRNLPFPIGVKWLIGIAATVALCHVLTFFVLKKIPGKIF